MLVHLLIKLSEALKSEKLNIVPEQLFSAARYILMAGEDSLCPDDNLKNSLKPILVVSVKEFENYDRAWKKLLSDTTMSQAGKLKFYSLYQGKFIKEEQNLPQEQWLPWRQYQLYKQGKISKDIFEHSVMQALAGEEQINKWENSFTKTLHDKFLAKDDLVEMEKLLEQAIGFRKEFSKIKRRWNKVVKCIPDSIVVDKNQSDKMGEKLALRPVYTEGCRANIHRWGNPELFMRPMEKITEKDMLQLQEPIRQMAEKLRIRLEWMRKRGKKYIDLRQTLRNCRKTYGEPMCIIKKQFRRKIPKWVVLSDVSGSVKHATRIFMSFLFELQSVMTENVQGFVFVSKIQEITNILQEELYQRMIERVYSESEIDFRGYSDYGVAFAEFDHIAKEILDRETILLIIGDARNNRRNPRLDLLQNWSRQTRKVLWFNPDLPEKWNQGDSIIGIYGQAIQNIYDVSTPEKLVNAVENIII